MPSNTTNQSNQFFMDVNAAPYHSCIFIPKLLQEASDQLILPDPNPVEYLWNQLKWFDYTWDSSPHYYQDVHATVVEELIDSLILMAVNPSRVILHLEIRESHTLYIYIYICCVF